jgi:hypothetical protein
MSGSLVLARAHMGINSKTNDQFKNLRVARQLELASYPCFTGQVAVWGQSLQPFFVVKPLNQRFKVWSVKITGNEF